MDAMGKMFASMLGITPAQVQEVMDNGLNAFKTMDARLSAIETMVAEIHAKICPVEYCGLLTIIDSNISEHDNGH